MLTLYHKNSSNKEKIKKFNDQLYKKYVYQEILERNIKKRKPTVGKTKFKEDMIRMLNVKEV